MFECDIEHRQSVAVLCILFIIHLMHLLYGALPGLYVPVQVTQGGLDAHQYTYAPPRCRTSQQSRTFVHLSVSLWNNLMMTPYSMVWNWRVSRSGPMPFQWPSCSLPLCLPLFSFSLFSFYELVLWGWGLQTNRVLIALSKPWNAYLLCNTTNNNNNIIIIMTSF